MLQYLMGQQDQATLMTFTKYPSNSAASFFNDSTIGLINTGCSMIIGLEFEVAIIYEGSTVKFVAVFSKP